jgi:hypothetical protein
MRERHVAIAKAGPIGLVFILSTVSLYAPTWGTPSGPSTPAGMSDWANTTIGTTNDSVATITLSSLGSLFTNVRVSSVGDLTHSTVGAETLTTTWKFSTDGDGSTASGVVETGTTQALGHNTYVASGSFLSTWVDVTQVAGDTDTVFTVTSHRENPYDFGNASDATEAPVPGTYTADLVLEVFGLF